MSGAGAGAGALDTRIDSTLVGGYFGKREGLWQEPIYRNVMGLLKEFGDAELAAMMAPRALALNTADNLSSRALQSLGRDVKKVPRQEVLHSKPLSMSMRNFTERSRC